MRLEPTRTYCFGVDGGSVDAGVCLTAPDADPIYRKAFHVTNPKEKPLEEKLLLLYHFLQQGILDALQIAWEHAGQIHPRVVIATEIVSPIPSRPRAVVVLSQCVGILRAVIWGINLWYPEVYPNLVEVTPSQAKLALTGKGRATKREMVAWAERQSGQQGWTEDEADAYGISLAARGWLHQQAMMQLAEEQDAETG